MHYLYYCETRTRSDDGEPLWKGIIKVDDPEKLADVLEAHRAAIRGRDLYCGRIVDVWQLAGDGLLTMVEETGFII